MMFCIISSRPISGEPHEPHQSPPTGLRPGSHLPVLASRFSKPSVVPKCSIPAFSPLGAAGGFESVMVCDMETVDTSPDVRARKLHSMLLQAFTGRQRELATVLGVSDATISRMKNEHLPLFCKMLSHSGLKCVPQGLKCMDPDQADAMFTMFQRSVSRAKSWEEILEWDEE